MRVLHIYKVGDSLPLLHIAHDQLVNEIGVTPAVGAHDVEHSAVKDERLHRGLRTGKIATAARRKVFAVRPAADRGNHHVQPLDIH